MVCSKFVKEAVDSDTVFFVIVNLYCIIERQAQTSGLSLPSL
jgi:hypothetical protein